MNGFIVRRLSLAQARGFFAGLSAVLLLLSGAIASAIPITVPATANGEFGVPEGGGTPLVSAFSLTAAGQEIQITASGTINLDASLTTGPDGVSVPRSVIMGNLNLAYTPLEEGVIDGGGSVPTTDANSTVNEVGALIGAFVPSATVSASGFSPIDAKLSDPNPGVNSTALFFVGAGPFTFTAPGAGTLYLGINEPFVSNNTGSFSATIVSVPEPSALVLAGLAGAICLIAVRKKPIGFQCD
jgi:hypothetical protein